MSCKPAPDPQSPTTFICICSEPLIEMAARLIHTWAKQSEAWLAYCRTPINGEVYRAPEMR